MRPSAPTDPTDPRLAQSRCRQLPGGGAIDAAPVRLRRRAARHAAGAALPCRRLRRRLAGRGRARWPALLADAGAVVVSVDYPLAPAHPFPQAHRGRLRGAAVGWQASAAGWPRTRAPLFVAGEEAGGNLAAAVAMMARDRGGPALAGADPAVADARRVRRHRLAARRPWPARWAAAGPTAGAPTWRAPTTRCTPTPRPGRSLRLAGLPPTLLISAADDPLRDETAGLRAAPARRRRAVELARARHDPPAGRAATAARAWPPGRPCAASATSGLQAPHARLFSCNRSISPPILTRELPRMNHQEHPSAAPARPAGRRRRADRAGAPLPAALFGLSSTPADANAAPAGAPPATPVSVATVVASEVAAWDEFSGRLEAVERVEIRSRAAGTVQAVHFREGALVQPGRPAVHDRPGALRRRGRARRGAGRRRAGARGATAAASSSARSACGTNARSPSASSTSAPTRCARPRPTCAPRRPRCSRPG